MIHPLVKTLLELRHRKGLTIEVMAQKVGVSQPTLTNWFLGKKEPRLLNFEAALNSLGYELVIREIPGRRNGVSAQAEQLVRDLANKTGRPIADIERSAKYRYASEELAKIAWHKSHIPGGTLGNGT